MPATFAHCLIAREAISKMGDSPYAGVLKMKNNFVVMGATGPDYPYLTDVITYGVLHIGHNWSNRMHYENVVDFVDYGIKALAAMDRKSERFEICLAWFLGYFSHVIVDSFVHPVINCITGGPYIFTHVEHGHCELIQDAYIFKKLTGTEIISAAPRDNTFGYLNILDDCSDPNDTDRINPYVGAYWTDLLKKTHPYAAPYFKDINPDEWHKNYKARIDFVADGRSIFRHVLDIANAPHYIAETKIDRADRSKYIDSVPLPNRKENISYDLLFEKTVDLVAAKWQAILPIIDAPENTLPILAKDWNLDTGVDESIIDLWTGVAL
jgi:hypothetical protein